MRALNFCLKLPLFSRHLLDHLSDFQVQRLEHFLL